MPPVLVRRLAVRVPAAKHARCYAAVCMSGPPDIFYFDFWHESALDTYFASLGRLLALAQRFESGCKVLAYLIFRRRNPEDLLGSEDQITHAIKRLYKQRLAQHIEVVAGAEDSARVTLNEARVARNEVAHTVALGFEHWLDEPDRLPSFREHIHSLALALATGDRWVSVVSSVLTAEPVPTWRALETYPEEFAAWVIGEERRLTT